MGNYNRGEYSEKLRDPRWQKLRLQVFERDGWKCLACSKDNETLVVHHLVYGKREPWESPMEDLETLCECCHGIREDFNKWMGDRSRVPTGVVLWTYCVLRDGFTDDLWKQFKQKGGYYPDFMLLCLEERKKWTEEWRAFQDKEQALPLTQKCGKSG